MYAWLNDLLQGCQTTEKRKDRLFNKCVRKPYIHMQRKERKKLRKEERDREGKGGREGGERERGRKKEREGVTRGWKSQRMDSPQSL